MNCRQIKVVTLGDSNVGKSSIIRRFVKGDFSDDEDPTIGAVYVGEVMDCEDSNVKFNIWDTAGQEKYHTLTKMYYRDAHVAILVYDITKYNSFVGLKRWVEEIENNGPKGIFCIIVGNKEDLVTHEEVPIDEAMSYAKSVGASYKKVSAKTNVGVDSIFQIIAKKKDSFVGRNSYENHRESIKVSKDDMKKKKRCC